MAKPKHETMLKQIAQERGIKLGWIAEKVGMEPTKFSRIANGVQLPDVVTALRIAELLDVSVRELWPWEDEKHADN